MNSRTRRFNLGDLMILVAAIAVATMTLRGLWQGLTSEHGARYWDADQSPLVIAAILSACATPLTVAGLAFRSRKPRPPWRWIAARPGSAALLACSVIFAFQASEVALAMVRPKVEFFSGTEVSSVRFGESVSLVIMRSKPGVGNGLIGHIEPLGCFGILTVAFTTSCGPAVAAVWLVLALSGRWRSERSWIDRLGRALGATWIVTSLLATFAVP